MQIISLVFGAEIKSKEEIGFYSEFFEREFLGVGDEREVYHLHNSFPTAPEEFEIFSKSSFGIPQAIKHSAKEIYGVLFHPEVRNKVMIVQFARM